MATPRIDQSERRGSTPTPNIEPKQIRNEIGIVEAQATEEDYNHIIKYMIKSYDLYKKQSKTESLIQEGKLKALEDMRQVIVQGVKSRYLEKERKRKTYKDDESVMAKFDISKIGPQYNEMYTIYTFLEGSINKERAELTILQASERLLERMDSELENALTEMSLAEEVRNRDATVYPLDIKVRVDNNLCGLKRPGGKKLFPCDGAIVAGTKYCQEHLKMYEPVKYSEIFEPRIVPEPVKTEEV